MLVGKGENPEDEAEILAEADRLGVRDKVDDHGLASDGSSLECRPSSGCLFVALFSNSHPQLHLPDETH